MRTCNVLVITQSFHAGWLFASALGKLLPGHRVIHFVESAEQGDVEDEFRRQGGLTCADVDLLIFVPELMSSDEVDEACEQTLDPWKARFPNVPVIWLHEDVMYEEHPLKKRRATIVNSLSTYRRGRQVEPIEVVLAAIGKKIPLQR